MALTKITTSLVAVNSLTAANIADNSIDATKIANNQILARHIAADALSDQIADNSITAGMIPNATALTLDGGLTVDNITIDGTEIDLSSGDLTIDVAGDITLDADGADIIFADGGTTFLEIDKDNNNARIKNPISDGDIKIQGNDGGSIITALDFDMSDAGAALFNGNIALAGGTDRRIQLSNSGTSGVDFSSNNTCNIRGDNDFIKINAAANGGIISEVNGTEYFRIAAGQVDVKSADLKLEDSRSLYLGAGNDLRIYHNGSHSYIKDQGTGNMHILTNHLSIHNAADDAIMMHMTDGGPIIMYNGYDATPGSGEGFFYFTNTASLTIGVSTTSSANALSIRNANGEKGIININGNTVAFTNLSDYREKENVNYSFDATSKLKQLKPCRFNWISDSTNTLQDGFLAHEVSSICPEAVVGEKDGVYTADDVAQEPHLVKGEAKNQMLDASKLIPLMVKTIQELEARIKTLEGA